MSSNNNLLNLDGAVDKYCMECGKLMNECNPEQPSGECYECHEINEALIKLTPKWTP